RFLQSLSTPPGAESLVSEWRLGPLALEENTFLDYAALVQGRAHSALLIAAPKEQYDRSLHELERCEEILAGGGGNAIVLEPGDELSDAHNAIVLLRDELCEGLANHDMIQEIGLPEHKQLVDHTTEYLT